jgi:hypothetical protein
LNAGRPPFDGAAFLAFAPSAPDAEQQRGFSMYASFRRPPPTKTVTFAVNYDDGRTAYLWLDDATKGSAKGDDHLVGAVARERQEQGVLPEGTIASIKRVR